MISTPLALKPPLVWRTRAQLLARPLARLLARLWCRCTRRRPPAPAPLGELGSHLLRDIQAPGRVHGLAHAHSELARYDRQKTGRGAGFQI